MTREKRSISPAPELAAAIDEVAAAEGTTVSAWIAQMAADRLRLEEGRRGVAEWEDEHRPLTVDEFAAGLARARALLANQAQGHAHGPGSPVLSRARSTPGAPSR